MTENLKALVALLDETTFDFGCYFAHDIGDLIVSLGGKYFSSGAYSCCFEFDGYCIKVSYDNFWKVPIFHLIFEKLCLPIYWIHKGGHICVCKLVLIIQDRGYDEYRTEVDKIKKIVLKMNLMHRTSTKVT